MQPRMVLKILALGFLSIVSSLPAHATATDETCRLIERTFAGYESPLECNLVTPRVREFTNNHYREMCAACDPNRQFYGDANNATNDSFDPSGRVSGTPDPLQNLNRVPTSNDVFKSIYPNLDAQKCHDDASYKAQNLADCADISKLWELFFGDPENQFGRAAAEFYNAFMTSHGIVDAATKKKPKDYSKDCADQNSAFSKVREKYNVALGVRKKAIWTNVLQEMAVKRGCLSYYIDEFPRFWCSESMEKGELQATNKDACVKKIAADPEKLLEQFKKYASDPAVLLARSNAKFKGITDQWIQDKVNAKILDVGPITTTPPKLQTKPAKKTTGGI